MKTAIMQPYFLPYIGYWQLINSVDTFIMYDNIQYTSKGWFNRNRYLKNGKDEIFSVSLKKDSNYLNVNERLISPDYNRKKLIAQFQNAYAKAPFKKEIMPLLETIINCEKENLFEYICFSIKIIADYLEIDTQIIVSSNLNIDHNLKSQDKVIALCKAVGADSYINPIGGIELYDKSIFEENEIELSFIKSNEIEYNQFTCEFVPWLSIVDVLMFNGKETAQEMLKEYELI